MEQTPTAPLEQGVTTAAAREDFAAMPATVFNPASHSVEPQACSSCGTSAPQTPGMSTKRPGANAPAWLYGTGIVHAIFPNKSIEKEFAQAAAHIETTGLTDRQLLYKVLSHEDYGYLAVECCFILKKHDIESFVLMPRRESVLKALVESLRHDPKPYDFHVVIGEVVGLSPPDKCNGLTLPLALVDQIYFSDKETLIKSIPKSDKVEAQAFERAAAEVFDRIMRMADNHGIGPDRALNCAALRSGDLYRAVAEAFARDESLAGVEARYSPLSGPQEMVEITLSFVHRKTGVLSKQCMTMNTSGKFPFVVTPLAPCW